MQRSSCRLWLVFSIEQPFCGRTRSLIPPPLVCLFEQSFDDQRQPLVDWSHKLLQRSQLSDRKFLLPGFLNQASRHGVNQSMLLVPAGQCIDLPAIAARHNEQWRSCIGCAIRIDSQFPGQRRQFLQRQGDRYERAGEHGQRMRLHRPRSRKHQVPLGNGPQVGFVFVQDEQHRHAVTGRDFQTLAGERQIHIGVRDFLVQDLFKDDWVNTVEAGKRVSGEQLMHFGLIPVRVADRRSVRGCDDACGVIARSHRLPGLGCPASFLQQNGRLDGSGRGIDDLPLGRAEVSRDVTAILRSCPPAQTRR